MGAHEDFVATVNADGSVKKRANHRVQAQADGRGVVRRRVDAAMHAALTDIHVVTLHGTGELTVTQQQTHEAASELRRGRQVRLRHTRGGQVYNHIVTVPHNVTQEAQYEMAVRYATGLFSRQMNALRTTGAGERAL